MGQDRHLILRENHPSAGEGWFPFTKQACSNKQATHHITSKLVRKHIQNALRLAAAVAADALVDIVTGDDQAH